MKTLSDEGKQEFDASRPILKEWLKQVLPWYQGFPDSSVGKESTCNAGDPSSTPRLGRYTGEGIGNSLQYSWASLVAQLVKNLPAMQEIWLWSLGWEDLLEKGKATPVFWAGEFHGLYSPWGCKELNTPEQISLQLYLLFHSNGKIIYLLARNQEWDKN